MTRRVWIAQCLCPSRHAILGGAGEANDRAEAEELVLRPLERLIAECLAAGVLNPWCSLCGAKRESWKFEVARSRFKNMAEANPVMREEEEKQAITRAIWGDLHRGKPN